MSSPAASPVRRILRSFERAFAVVGLIAFLYHGAFHLSVIASASMAPTLRGDDIKNGDHVLSERVSYRVRKPRRWEVVMYRDPEQQLQVMKRVVGLPGETISFNDKTQTFFVDGKPVTRPESLTPIKYLSYGNLANGKAVSTGAGYFVLGDFSADSQDSRWLGPVASDRILARPWLVVWPPSHVRRVNP